MGPQAVAGLADVLQERLAGDTSRQHSGYSRELELLLRAVPAILQGSNDGHYIATALRGGVFQLVLSLSRQMPTFAEQVGCDAWFQAILGDYYRPAK